VCVCVCVCMRAADAGAAGTSCSASFSAHRGGQRVVLAGRASHQNRCSCHGLHLRPGGSSNIRLQFLRLLRLVLAPVTRNPVRISFLVAVSGPVQHWLSLFPYVIPHPNRHASADMSAIAIWMLSSIVRPGVCGLRIQTFRMLRVLLR